MSKFPLVSIIMNCYNGDKYIYNSVNSIIYQDYYNWELVFWDNKSNDNSAEIIKSYNDKRIKYYLSDGYTSLYKARNLALNQTQGEYICFLDVDDWWPKERLSKQIYAFNNNDDIDLIYSNYFICNDQNKSQKLFSKKLLPSGHLTSFILDDYKIGLSTVLIKKKSLYCLENFFNNDYSIIGDYDLIFRLSKKLKFKYINLPLAYYRVHKNNLSKNYDLYIDELKNWYFKNLENFPNKKNYVYKKFNYLIILQLVLKKEKIQAIKKFLEYPFCFLKIKLFFMIIVPLSLIKIFKDIK
jgi:glycosyltransferase involved in cell wall biosynthesis